MDSNNKTPGVYISEENAFSNSVVPVASAVPAFVGYTPQAMYMGKSYTSIPVKITSFQDFQTYFCLPGPETKQYAPQYYLTKLDSKPSSADYMEINGAFYSLLPDPNTIYYLYNSIRLFYQNGGGDAYIVSVGPYGAPSGKAGGPDQVIINPNVKLEDLKRGLELLKNAPESTMYICPEATLLSVSDNGLLMQAMLQQCTEMQTAMSLFDIIGGKDPDPLLYTNDIQTFRNNTGDTGLMYGAAYYPFLKTTITDESDVDYTNFFGGDISQLEGFLNPGNTNAIITKIFTSIRTGSMTVSQNNQTLLVASPMYSIISKAALSDINTLPPSGGMAGVITTTDNAIGPWQAPANTSIVGVYDLTLKLDEAAQAPLNIDPVSGKSVNVIRFFNGLGVLVWGARTLDGNSQDWRYIPVRRTVTLLEQSCKTALQNYIFAPTNPNTWSSVTAMLSNFLTSMWKEGALMGATAADAFSVACGLGSTMTSDDILNGFLNVTIQVAVAHPGEFIVISLQQQMAKS